MKPKKANLLQSIKDIPKIKRSTFLDRLPEETRIELIAVGNAIISGEIITPKRYIVDKLNELGVDITKNNLEILLRDIRRGVLK